ncbi:MAG TPA: hypothetical protein VD902_05590, partial [Symbiobacteriaceae bacterium]|nr:hypothetical protein [Symbiobacteriaceae bacterium]
MAGFRPRLIAGLLLLVALAAPGCTRDTATAGDAQPPAATQEAHAAETLALRVKQGDQFTYH